MTALNILVFSDSHHSRWDMIEAIEAQSPDMIIHLGDMLRDAEDIGYAFEKLPLVCVPGNCDGWTGEPLQKLITVEKQKILLSHGHIWGVKQSYKTAIAAGKQVGAQILLFGHTHRHYCQMHDGMWVMNPGASRTSYGKITIVQGRIHCSITELI